MTLANLNSSLELRVFTNSSTFDPCAPVRIHASVADMCPSDDDELNNFTSRDLFLFRTTNRAFGATARCRSRKVRGDCALVLERGRDDAVLARSLAHASANSRTRRR